MTKSKKQIREYQAQIAAERVLKEQLNESNDAYNQRAFRYLRFLVHLLAAAQFIYGIYYYWFNVYFPNDLAEEEELKTRWGGKFKYLTFLNVILQAIYHSVALLNDIFGTNAVNPKQPVPALRQVKDFIFAAWAFPVAMNVCISFWVIYAIDRELIFPAALDEIFPTWLNHIVHTNVAMMIIMDMFTCFRVYPTRLIGVVDNMVFMILYLIWLHIVRYFSGQWVYPLLEVLNLPMRYLMLCGMLAFTVLCYFLGEYLNNMVWAPELKMLKKKAKLG